MVTYTSEMTTQEWIEERKKYIGGSDTGGILNNNPYSSPLTIWKIKKNLLEIDETINIKKGNDLEPVILRKFQEKTDKNVFKPDVMFHHPEYNFMIANVDGLIEDEKAVVEAKYVSLNGEDAWSDGVPAYYYSQVQHYMNVLNYEKAYVVALFESVWDIAIYEIKRNDLYIEKKLIPMEIEFYKAMQSDNPPFPVKPDELLDDLYIKAKLVVTEGVDDLLQEYTQLKKQAKILNTQVDEVKTKLIILSGDTKEKTALEGNTYQATVSWSNGRVYFDQTRFKEEHPDLHNAYQAQSKGFYTIRTKAKKNDNKETT